MFSCTICEEIIPKPRRCTHGKKTVNCGRACQTAYVEEHIAMCQGKKVANDRKEFTDPEEKDSRARTSNNGQHTMEKADQGFTETVNLKNTGDYEAATYPRFDSSEEAIVADPDADLAEVDPDVAQGILDMIKDLIHMPELTNCRNCNKNKEAAGIRKIRKCKGCALVGYCGTECQRQHWDLMHKEECTILRGLAQVELSKADVEQRLKWLGA